MVEVDLSKSQLPLVSGDGPALRLDPGAASDRRSNAVFRRWFVVGVLVSAGWLALCAYYIAVFTGWQAVAFLLPHELAAMVSAVAVPLVVLWLVVFYRRRGGLIERHARALLDLSEIYRERSSFPNARESAEDVLAFAPGHREATMMLARIAQEEEAAALDKWDDRRGGRGPFRLRRGRGR